MSDEQVTLKVDGKDVTVPKGTNVLQAVLKSGGQISYFCYHPGLSVVAVCRQCLVDIKGQPKLVPACQVMVAPGMEVDNSGPRVLEARRAMLEFTLLNHPIDCPICDKAGECVLQKQYMEWDRAPARGDDLLKIRKPKRIDIGPHIVLDAERCILCSRCIRVCDEVAGTHELEMTWRGARQELQTAPNRRLENAYSLNTVDVCPVGALTSKDFRFKRRVWQLYSTASVCTGCATGCNDEIHHVDGRVYRLVPRPNPQVNKYWMCDEGRFTYKETTKERIARARVNGSEATISDAIDAAARIIDAARPAVGFVLSPRACNEDNYLASKIALDYLGIDYLYLSAGAAPWKSDGILKSADRNPNQAGAIACGRGRAKTSAALREDLESGRVGALFALDGDFAVAEKTCPIVVTAWHESPLTRQADVVLPAASWAEIDGTMINEKGMIQRLHRAVSPPGDAQPHHEILAQLGRRLGLALDPVPSRAIFAELRSALPQFTTADFGPDTPPTLLRFANSRG